MAAATLKIIHNAGGLEANRGVSQKNHKKAWVPQINFSLNAELFYCIN